LNALTASHGTGCVDTRPASRPTNRPCMVLQQHTKISCVDICP